MDASNTINRIANCNYKFPEVCIVPDIIKAYLQSPRTWVAIGTITVTWFHGNKMGLSDEVILMIVDGVAALFGVSVSVRAPRLWDDKDVPAA